MIAKSDPEFLPALFLAWLARATRYAVTILLLAISVATLGAVVEERFGPNFFRGTYTRILSWDVFQSSAPAEDARANWAATPAEEARFRLLADFLARKYKVSQDQTYDFVGIAHAAGRDYGLDPLLIIAVMAVESRFNPIAESGMGAKGLMQVIPAYHQDKLREFGGAGAVYDPETNISVGARILKEYVVRTGNVSMALQMYAGALKDENDGYTHRVFGEHQRLQAVLSQHARAPGTRRPSSPL